MPAFMKVTGRATGVFKGDSTDSGHVDWVRINRMVVPMHRTNPSGTVDQQRMRGQTMLDDLTVIKQVDRSTPSLCQASASNEVLPSVLIHFCSTINGKQEPYLTYELSNACITYYGFSGDGDGTVLPTDEIRFTYQKATMTYIVLDPDTGSKKGNVVGTVSATFESK